MKLCKHRKTSSIAFIKYFTKIIEGKCCSSTSWSKKIFLICTHISLPGNQNAHLKHITNQNWCDITTVFKYSQLNTPINQWESAYYSNYFINRTMKNSSLAVSFILQPFSSHLRREINCSVVLWTTSLLDDKSSNLTVSSCLETADSILIPRYLGHILHE